MFDCYFDFIGYSLVLVCFCLLFGALVGFLFEVACSLLTCLDLLNLLKTAFGLFAIDATLRVVFDSLVLVCVDTLFVF